VSRCWGLDFGFWILDSGFWIFWISKRWESTDLPAMMTGVDRDDSVTSTQYHDSFKGTQTTRAVLGTKNRNR
jgi:hypothetical protein